MKEFYQVLVNPKGKYGIWGIVVFVLLGIALMTVPGLFLHSKQPVGTSEQASPGAETQVVSAGSLAKLEISLAEQVCSILSKVEGAGRVSVSVTLENGFEKEYALDVTKDSSIIEEKDTNGGVRTTNDTNHKAEVVIAQGRNEPLVIKEIGPKIKGVLVVSEGAKESEIREKLGRAVQTMLNLPAHRVMVLPGLPGESR